MTTTDSKIAAREAALRAVDWLVARIGPNGSLGEDCRDLACYYKLPYLMQLAGRPADAHRLLDWIRARFLRPDGDLRTSDAIKTADPVLALYPGYIDGWIAIAGHRIGRFDLSFPIWNRLRGFWSPELDGFTLEPVSAPNGGTLEILTCAHLGLVALYLGDLELARGAGRALRRFLARQPFPQTRFYLRIAGSGQVQTDFPTEAAGLHLIAADQPGQAWFFIGYPVALLARLYRATGETEHLATAQGYLAFAERCAPCMVTEHFAHKVAWGAAELAYATHAEAAYRLSAEIARYLVAAQSSDGTWMADQPMHTRVDQSAELAIWLLEIAGLG
jgi:hypothetical protein